MKKIIMISGYSGSGKSTLIQQLNKKYKFNIIKFGMIHREATKYYGYPYAKDLIKEKGFDVYEKQLLICFRDNIIATVKNSNNPIIIDGVFSDKCLKYIKSIDNLDVKNIVLDTKYDVRVHRMMEREKLSYDDVIKHLLLTDNIKKEAGLEYIIKNYDYVIDGNISKKEILKYCESILELLEIYPNSNDIKKEIER